MILMVLEYCYFNNINYFQNYLIETFNLTLSLAQQQHLSVCAFAVLINNKWLNSFKVCNTFENDQHI